MAEPSDYYCPEGCTHRGSDDAPALLLVHRDRFGYVDGYQCQICGALWRQSELQQMDGDETTPVTTE